MSDAITTPDAEQTGFHHRTEPVAYMGSQALMLCFSPQSIRDHFECSNNPNSLDNITDAQLAEVAETALQYDALYKIFHELLTEACEEVLGFDPDDDDEDENEDEDDDE